MALQVWLPLNGKIENQGLSGVTVSGSPASWGNGLLGKCATFTGGQIIKSEAVHDFDYKDNFSWACWVNTNRGSGTVEYIFSVGRVDSTTFGYGLQNDSSTHCIVWFGSWRTTIPVSKGVWTHIAFTKSGSTMRIYINGVLQQSVTFNAAMPTFANSVGLGIGCFHYSSGDIYKYNGSVADFRIYDNALSPKEVHEIAQGLCCHYPLNDPTPTASINKYSGDTFEGKSSDYSSCFTMSKLTNERGYKFVLNYTGTGTDHWEGICYPYITFTAGKTYDYSCKVRANSGNFSFSFRASRMSNDWSATVKSVINCDGKWHEYHTRITLEAKSVRSGTEYDTKPLIEFCSQSLKTKDTVYKCDIDIKDIQISECNTDASVSNGAWNDLTVYDTSGFGNHGSVTTASAPILAGDSARYDRCYELAYKHYITGEMPFNGQAMSAFTINVWLNNIDGGGYSTWFNSNGYGGSGLWLAVNVEGSGQWAYRSVSPNYVKNSNFVTANTWYMFTYVYNAGVATWYLNGVKGTSTTYTDKTLAAGTTFTLGDSYTGTQWNTKFHGKLSDFRIYATALSDEDVATLYKTPISVTSGGAMIVKGEVIESI